MFTTQQLAQIDTRLHEGVTPENLAAEMGLSYTQLRHRLANSGRRISIILTQRRLEVLAPADAPRELTAA
jgi:AraC-like DNA-binding protein